MPILLIIFINKCTKVSAVIKEISIPKITSWAAGASAYLIPLMVVYNVAATIIGIESKKDIFADEVLLNPNSSAAVIVTPDLEVPGIIANVCANPINTACFHVSAYISRILLFF